MSIKSKTFSAEQVRILCAANAAYAGPLSAMLVSLLINFAPDRKLDIYVIATNIPEEDRQKIEASLRHNRPDFDLGSLHWLFPDMGLLRGLHVDKWIDLETYGRLLAPLVLPEDCDKVLYLDSDMVILSDVSVLYDSLNDNAMVHAARDQFVGVVSDSTGVFNYEALGIPPRTPYFNAGVLLINLRRWRQENVTGRAFDYLKQYQSAVQCWDQGALNALLHHDWTEIDPAWNQTNAIFYPERWKAWGNSIADWKKTRDHPKIVHYTTGEKPWLGDTRPRYSYFFNYLDKTGYRDTFQGPRLERIIGFRLNYLLWRMKVFLFWKRTPQDIIRVLKRMGMAQSR
jgi:lipopolysaccharide biosynthesis glycosyltransferase